MEVDGCCRDNIASSKPLLRFRPHISDEQQQQKQEQQQQQQQVSNFSVY
jgi:hypothetical protein